MTAMPLSMMAHKARDEMAGDTIEAIADKGYYKGEAIVACEQADIAVTVSKPHTSNAAAVGRFDRADFVYDTKKDAYQCPAGKWLPYHYTNKQDGKTLRNYWTNDCVPAWSSTDVRPAGSAASVAGNTRISWSASKSVLTMIPIRSRCAAEPSSIHLA